MNLTPADDFWKIGPRTFRSRLLHCFGSEASHQLSPEEAASLILESGTEFLTIYTHGDLNSYRTVEDFPLGTGGLRLRAVRDKVDLQKYTILVNVNQAVTPAEAVRRAERAAEISGSNWIKLEVLNRKFQRPVNSRVIAAAAALRKKGYEVLPLITNDPVDARVLEDLGCLAVRITMADIGSLRGLPQDDHYSRAREHIRIPIIAEGGLGRCKDAFHSLASGADAVLVNSVLFSVEDRKEFLRTLNQKIREGRACYVAATSATSKSSAVRDAVANQEYP